MLSASVRGSPSPSPPARPAKRWGGLFAKPSLCDPLLQQRSAALLRPAERDPRRRARLTYRDRVAVLDGGRRATTLGRRLRPRREPVRRQPAGGRRRHHAHPGPLRRVARRPGPRSRSDRGRLRRDRKLLHGGVRARPERLRRRRRPHRALRRGDGRVDGRLHERARPGARARHRFRPRSEPLRRRLGINPFQIAFGPDRTLYISHDNGVIAYNGRSGVFLSDFASAANARGIAFYNGAN
jgi:hypothetical protein